MYTHTYKHYTTHTYAHTHTRTYTCTHTHTNTTPHTHICTHKFNCKLHIQNIWKSLYAHMKIYDD